MKEATDILDSRLIADYGQLLFLVKLVTGYDIRFNLRIQPYPFLREFVANRLLSRWSKADVARVLGFTSNNIAHGCIHFDSVLSYPNQYPEMYLLYLKLNKVLYECDSE